MKHHLRHYAIYFGWVEEIIEIVTTSTTTANTSNASEEAMVATVPKTKRSEMGVGTSFSFRIAFLKATCMFLHINDCVRTRLHLNLNHHFWRGCTTKNINIPKSWFNKNTNWAVHAIALKKPNTLHIFQKYMAQSSSSIFQGRIGSFRECNPQKFQLLRFPPIFSLNNDHGRKDNPFPNLPSWELTDPPSKKGTTFESMIFLFPRWAICNKKHQILFWLVVSTIFYFHPETWGNI